MTFLILLVAALYAASFCFVVVLLARTLWQERSTPLETTVTPVTLTAATATTPDINQVSRAGMRHTAKSA